MIKKKTVYEVFGKVFRTLREAKKYYSATKEVEKIRSILPKYKEEGCEFTNGGGYLQLTQKQVDKFVSAIGDYLEKYEDKEISDAFKKNPRSYFVGRSLDDGGSELYSIYCLFLQIDGQNRLWGQIYYANNPDKGTQQRLN